MYVIIGDHEDQRRGVDHDVQGWKGLGFRARGVYQEREGFVSPEQLGGFGTPIYWMQ